MLLSIRCTKMGKSTSVDIDMHYESLAKNWDKLLPVQCEHCGDVHYFKTSDVLIDKAARRQES